MKTFLVRYSEIGLKSRPVRVRFENKLVSNITRRLASRGVKAGYSHGRKRIFIHVPDECIKKSVECLQKTFGVASFSLSEECATDIKTITKGVEKLILKDLDDSVSLAVRVKRADKDFPMKSPEVSAHISDNLIDKTGCSIDLKNPDVEIFVEIRPKMTSIFREKIPGPVGLPYGTAGKVVVLLSGGIDSSVAAWLIMKKGCKIIPVFADNGKFGGHSKRVFLDVLELLSEYGDIPFYYTFKNGRNLSKFKRLRPSERKYKCLLCKRGLYRAANEVASKEDCKAIVTGENLAQVASQTLQNLQVIDEASSLPVFRPLISFEKDDIIRIARDIGSFELSVDEKSECSAVPGMPATAARLTGVRAIEERTGSDFGTLQKHDYDG